MDVNHPSDKIIPKCHNDFGCNIKVEADDVGSVRASDGHNIFRVKDEPMGAGNIESLAVSNDSPCIRVEISKYEADGHFEDAQTEYSIDSKCNDKQKYDCWGSLNEGNDVDRGPMLKVKIEPSDNMNLTAVSGTHCLSPPYIKKEICAWDISIENKPTDRCNDSYFSNIKAEIEESNANSVEDAPPSTNQVLEIEVPANIQCKMQPCKSGLNTCTSALTVKRIPRDCEPMDSYERASIQQRGIDQKASKNRLTGMCRATDQNEGMQVKTIPQTAYNAAPVSLAPSKIGHKQDRTKLNSTKRLSSTLHVGTDSNSKDSEFKCDHCHRVFKLKFNLRSHMSIHSNEIFKSVKENSRAMNPKFRFKCTVCNKSFSKSGILSNHKRVHTNERPYHCTLCDKSFRQSSALTSHMRVHTKERPYRCTVCEKSFSKNNTLTTHMRVHTNDRPHQCTVCDKSFSKSGSLTIHMRVHTKERPYPCTVCDKFCISRSNLTQHLRVHTKERPYHCNLCDKSFSQSGNLASHKMRAHT